MKKVFFAISYLFAVISLGFAQSDTVYVDLTDSNYYNPEEWLYDSTIMIYTPQFHSDTIITYTELRYTESPLVVYGIVLVPVGPTLVLPADDPDWLDSITSRYTGAEQAWLYKPGVDGSMTPLGYGDYNVFAPTPYYMQAQNVAAYRYVTRVSLPIYETYFDDVAMVTDSFYIGSTAHFIPHCIGFSHCATLIASHIYYSEYFIDPTTPIDSLPYSIHREFYMNAWHWSTTRFTLEQYVRGGYPNSRITLICYPILTPDPNRDTVANPYHYPWDTVSTDTTQVDTTHSGISARLLERYINVYPTVADGGAVSVLSSFHLEGVEVYDAAGRMLSRQPASGVATSIDVSQLPAGSYVLRVNTVSGSTAKKFLKR